MAHRDLLSPEHRPRMNDIQLRLRALLPAYGYSISALTRALRAAGLETDNRNTVRRWINGESYPVTRFERQLLDVALPGVEEVGPRRKRRTRLGIVGWVQMDTRLLRPSIRGKDEKRN